MRRARTGLTFAAAAWLAVSGCSTSTTSPVADAGVDAGFGVSTRDAAPSGVADGRVDRLVYHGGETFPRMRLRLVYIGDEGVDAAPNVDEFSRWLVSSSWWRLLREYGIEEATLEPSARVSFQTMFPPGTVVDGLIEAAVFDLRVRALLHPEPADAGADAGDASPFDAASPVAPSDAYMFMLPNGVNVSLGDKGSRTYQTCIDSGGYHAHDGVEAYAVIPPCRVGRSALTLSHEVAELATNPRLVDGWFSDDEADRKIGAEIADVCNFPVSRGVDGWLVTQLWSNAEGRCIPL